MLTRLFIKVKATKILRETLEINISLFLLQFDLDIAFTFTLENFEGKTHSTERNV